jgi:hypothetical protein
VSIGCLARTFPASILYILEPVTKALKTLDSRVAAEAAHALYKFSNSKNYHHIEHSRTILELNGAQLLLPWLTDQDAYTQKRALMLLCCLSVNIPDHSALAQAMVRTRLENMTRSPVVSQNLDLRTALADAISKLELFQASIAKPHNMVRMNNGVLLQVNDISYREDTLTCLRVDQKKVRKGNCAKVK